MNTLQKGIVRILFSVFALQVLSGFTVITQTEASPIKIDGSSTVYPITEAVAEEFGVTHRNSRVTIGVSGTGGGFKKFCNGETDINNASRPIKASEIKLCKEKGIDYIELPVAFDGLAVVVNPKNDWLDAITVSDLKKIWQPNAKGTITHWHQIHPNWPNEEMLLFGPGTDSGTFDYFTKAINGKEGASRSDYTASEDDNILVHGIANDKYALGYFGLAYYEENKTRLKLLGVDNEDGRGPILPSQETVNQGTYRPFSRPIFIYVSRKRAEDPEVNQFVHFYLSHAKTLAKEVGYVPLPESTYKMVIRRFEDHRTGTLFANKGKDVDIPIEALMANEK